jgi:hypothetical protein
MIDSQKSFVQLTNNEISSILDLPPINKKLFRNLKSSKPKTIIKRLTFKLKKLFVKT